MYRELVNRIDLRMNYVNHKLSFIIYNNKKSMNITRYLTDEIIQMGMNSINETYNIPMNSWNLPSNGIIEKVNREIQNSKELCKKIKDNFLSDELNPYISVINE